MLSLSAQPGGQAHTQMPAQPGGQAHTHMPAHELVEIRKLVKRLILSVCKCNTSNKQTNITEDQFTKNNKKDYLRNQKPSNLGSL